MTKRANESIATLIERVLSGEMSPEDAIHAWDELPKEDQDRDALAAWHALVHYREDEDIRAQDQQYAERQRRGLERWVARLRTHSGSILGL